MKAGFDFLVVGDSPAAALLAGILANTHNRSVCRAGRFLHALRPRHGFDLTFAPVTRPQTWHLLSQTIPQTMKILAEIGPQKVTAPIQPLLITHVQNHADALAHMRTNAAYYGFDVDRLAISGHFLSGYRFRDTQRVLRRPLFAQLPVWLQNAGVQTISTDELRLTVQKNGSTRATNASESFITRQVILADDDAILTYLGKRDVDALFRRVPTVSVMTEPTGMMTSSLMHLIDDDLLICQQETGALGFTGAGTAQRLGALVSRDACEGRPLRVSGKAQFEALHSHDGAPVLGKLRMNLPILLAGFGRTGLFQTPAIARVLTRTGTDFEKNYFAACTPSGDGIRKYVAEFSPENSLEPVA